MGPADSYMLYTMYMNLQHLYPHLEFSDTPPSIIMYPNEGLQRALSRATKVIYSGTRTNRTASESDLQEKQNNSPITAVVTWHEPYEL